jgi:hypothetical protein
MRRSLLGAGFLLLASGMGSALALNCDDGQMPVPPAVANRMALPLCGFAATKRFGPNGCQLCDPRNIYPPLHFDRSGRVIDEYREYWRKAPVRKDY